MDKDNEYAGKQEQERSGNARIVRGSTSRLLENRSVNNIRYTRTFSQSSLWSKDENCIA